MKYSCCRKIGGESEERDREISDEFGGSRLIGGKGRTGDRLIWKKAVALWQSRWLWFAGRAVFAAFACFFTRHHSETLLSRGAITGTRDEQDAGLAVVPRRR